MMDLQSAERFAGWRGHNTALRAVAKRAVWGMGMLTAMALASPLRGQTTLPVSGDVSGAASQPIELSPKQLAARIRQLNDQEEKLKVACFDLSSPVVEKPSDLSLLLGDDSSLTLGGLIERLHHARDDRQIRAVLVTLGSPKTNLAQSQEIRDALLEIRQAGKKVFVYADGYDTDTYTIATGASNICILNGGGIEIPGVGIETMYLKGLFDKLGVKADYVQIGAYKGADEEFTRTGPSPQFAGELNKLMDGLYNQVITGISQNRNLPLDLVRSVVDEAILSAQSAQDRGFVDDLVDVDGMRDLIADDLGTKVQLIQDYDAPSKETVDLSNPFAILSMLAKKPPVSQKPAIAMVFADGVIVDGGAASLLDGETIGSDTIRKAMREIANDNSIKAVVIRINSPGGSALASEAMWQSVRRVSKTKPVVISIGSMAASGGYYLASAGDHIFADPSAIVGSIGVVGGKFVTKDLFDKLGITTDTFSRGQNADLFGSDAPFTDHQRKMVGDWMTETYDQFTERVMSTRGQKIKKIEDVAQGRVFIAQQAMNLGLIDEIGPANRAVAYAAEQAHLNADTYDVRTLPPPRTLADILSGSGAEDASPLRSKLEISDDSLLKAMPGEIRSMVAEQLEVLQLMQNHPVVLVAPFSVREGLR